MGPKLKLEGQAQKVLTFYVPSVSTSIADLSFISVATYRSCPHNSAVIVTLVILATAFLV